MVAFKLTLLVIKYLIGLILLIWVSFYGFLGKGARRWINFFGYNFQPSEIMKILFIEILTLLSIFIPLRVSDDIKIYNVGMGANLAPSVTPYFSL